MIPSYRYKALIKLIRSTAEQERELVALMRKGDPSKPVPGEFLAPMIEHIEAVAFALDKIADELTALSRPH